MPQRKVTGTGTLFGGEQAVEPVHDNEACSARQSARELREQRRGVRKVGADVDQQDQVEPAGRLVGQEILGVIQPHVVDTGKTQTGLAKHACRDVHRDDVGPMVGELQGHPADAAAIIQHP